MSSQILFQCVSGVPVPVYATTPDGFERRVDGVRFLNAEQAAIVAGKPVETMIDAHGIFMAETMGASSAAACAARTVVREHFSHLTDPQFELFLQQCQRLGFHPLSDCLWPKLKYSDRTGREELTVLLSADGFFAVAQRTRELLEFIGPQWSTSEEGPWRDIPPRGDIYAARVGVKRVGMDEPLYMVAMWSAYAQIDDRGNLAEFWDRMGAHMIGKCASCVGLRRVFSDQLSGVFSPEEMMQAGNPRPGRPGPGGQSPVMRLVRADDEYFPQSLKQLENYLIQTMNFLSTAHRVRALEHFKSEWAPTFSRNIARWCQDVVAELKRDPERYGIENSGAA